jgi:two-component system, NarL family, response regulator DevR
VTMQRLSRRLTVCAISKHPGLVTSIERLLGGSEFRVIPLRLERSRLSGAPLNGHEVGHARMPKASVFVLDANASSLGTEALIENIRSQHPRARMLIIKETSRDEKVFPYLRLGARGVVRYSDAESDLANAAKAVAAGDFWVPQRQLIRFVDWILATPSYRGTLSEPGGLSRREREVLASILNGLTNKEIASTLNISERTVKFHVSHLLQKLGAHRRADLIAKQYQLWPALT